MTNDKEYLAKKNEQDKKFANLEEMYSKDEETLVEELKHVGFLVKSVWDFVNSENNYFDAVPILINHLKVKHHPKTLAGLARSLAISDLSNNDELWSLLVDIYDKTPSNSEISIPEDRGAQEAIAIALECLAVDSRANSLKVLIERNSKGDGIHWLQDKLKKIS